MPRAKRVDDAMKLAESLGAETQTLSAAICRRKFSASRIRKRHADRDRPLAWRVSSANCCAVRLPHELVRRTDDIAIHLVTRRVEGAPATPPRRRARFVLQPLPFLYATLAVGAALAIGKALTALTPIPNLSMLFLVAVLFIAVNFGMWPAIYASGMSFLTYNFFFIPPLYTFTIAEPYELLALVDLPDCRGDHFGACRPGARTGDRSRPAACGRRGGSTNSPAGCRDSRRSTPWPKAPPAKSMPASAAQSWCCCEQSGDLTLTAAWPPEDALDAAPMTAARWAFSHGEPAGADTGTLPIVPWYFVPLRIGEKKLGVIGVAKPEGVTPLDSEARALLDALSEQTAAALERASLARDMVSAKTATETERVRNTLLASISHDFRTPLSSILGSATSLIDYGDKFDAAARKDLLVQIKQETESLDEMVRNLLAITRIDAGALELRRDWIDLREIVDRVVSAARRRGARQRIEVALPADLPLVRADATLVEQAFGNVMGNAIVHTPPETRVQVDAQVGASQVALRVTDDGPGIPAQALPQIFDKFVKADTTQADGGQGTGLGLAIAKGIMEAHGGSIAAESPHADGRGTRIVLTFPRPDAPA